MRPRVNTRGKNANGTIRIPSLSGFNEAPCKHTGKISENSLCSVSHLASMRPRVNTRGKATSEHVARETEYELQ